MIVQKGEMALKRRKNPYGTLKRTNDFLDLSPAGRNLFISRDKQLQHRQARRLQLWMKIVLALVIAGVCTAIGLFVLFYLAPWFRAEVTLDRPVSAVSSETASESEILEYDELGLPVYSEKICLFVINPNSPAAEDYAPKLSEVSGVQVDARCAEALRALCNAAKEDGLSLMLQEGYISYGEQQKRFDAKVEQLQKEQELTAVMARSAAAKEEPQPGESDFQSGMTIRLVGSPETFEDSRTYSWLKANMGKYGFIFRYPNYKEDYTRVAADLTVIRYVGSASAAAMQQRSMCLEEYISYLNSQ